MQESLIHPDEVAILLTHVQKASNFNSDQPLSILNKDSYVFLVDRSGSMAGRKIDMVKEALLLFMQSLPVGCAFQIISFGTEFEKLVINN
jgi:uncharacterized protein with von Willebrand factor type A (vWA) domain